MIRAGRLVAIGACLGVGWVTLQSITALLQGPNVSVKETPSGDHPAESLLPAAWTDRGSDGFWSFAGCTWQVARFDVPLAELDTRLGDLEFASYDPVSQSSKESLEFLQMLRLLRLPQPHPNGLLTYRLDGEGYRVRIIVREMEGEERVVGGVAAVPLTEKTWSLIQLRQPEDSPGSFPRDQSHLLPMPEGGQTVCWHEDRQGRLNFEVLRCNVASRSLLEHWVSTGWKVYPHPRAAAKEFNVECVRGDHTVYAWAPEKDGPSKFLLLVRNQ